MQWCEMKPNRRPNLFIIGAMKSGTTSLHTWLGGHPQIFMCTPKEPNYFLEEFNWSKGETWYLNLFAASSGEPIIGESSVSYAKAPTFDGVPQRIAKFNPEAHFIYIMRDPVERTISHYWHAVRHQAERRDMFTAVRETPHFRYVSHYSAQLSRYHDYFGPERIFPITLEELVGDSAKVLHHLFTWLGVDPSFDVTPRSQPRNVTPQQVTQVRGVLHRLHTSPVWRVVEPLVPHALRRVGRQLATKRIDRGSQPVTETAEFLKPIQLEQTRELSTLLGRQFPEWETLSGKKTIKDSIIN